MSHGDFMPPGYDAWKTRHEDHDTEQIPTCPKCGCEELTQLPTNPTEPEDDFTYRCDCCTVSFDYPVWVDQGSI